MINEIKLFPFHSFSKNIKEEKNITIFHEKFLEYKLYKKFSFRKRKINHPTKNKIKIFQHQRKNKFSFKNQTFFNRMKDYTISAITKNELGSTSRLISLLLRKGFKILNLTFGKSEKKEYSRVTLVIQEYPKNLNRFLFNLKNFIQITELINITELPSIEREILLIKLKNSMQNQEILLNLVNFYRFKIADIGEESLTMQISDIPERIDKFEFQFCKNFEVLQSVRSGKISLLAESADTINQDQANKFKLNQTQYQYCKIKKYFI